MIESFGRGNGFVPIALYGWLFLTAYLFMVFPGRRAALACCVWGTLFLPVAGIPIPGLPDYTKQTAVAGGALLGVLLFDPARVMSLRLRWFDLPVIVLTTTPMATSLSNGLGAYDGLAAVFGFSMQWAVPYFVGRVYFREYSDLRDLTLAIVVGALVYVPLCLFEMRMSPQLHTWVYGFHQHQFAQTKRFGGFRPTVFMSHGLLVAMWMASATIAASWLWASGAVRRHWGLSIPVIVFTLMTTMVLCKSVGATVLMATGLLSLLMARLAGTKFLLLLLIVFPMAYAGMRITGMWTFGSVVELSNAAVGDVAGGSLNFRLEGENALIRRAGERVMLGWGGWGRNRPDGGKDLVTDGLWVITYSQYGLVGLSALFGTLLLGPSLFAWKVSARNWLRPDVSSAAALVFILVLFTIDSLFNAGVTPVFVLAVGAIAGVVGSARSPAAATTRPRSRESSRRGTAPSHRPIAEIGGARITLPRAARTAPQ